MSKKSCNCSHPRGITLVEVLGALALLSVLLVGVLAAHHRHARQIARARKTLAAAEQVDAMLYEWANGSGGLPRDARGDLSEGEFWWQTRVISQRHRAKLGIDIVRLTVYAKEDLDTQAERAKPLISLELASPAPQWPPEESQP